MSRSDAWNRHDDDTLVEIVLSNIENGHTQLDAFEQAALQLSRTASACGFRWNSKLRHDNADKVVSAKAKRLEARRNKGKANTNDTKDNRIVLSRSRIQEQHKERQFNITGVSETELWVLVKLMYRQKVTEQEYDVVKGISDDMYSALLGRG